MATHHAGSASLTGDWQIASPSSRTCAPEVQRTAYGIRSVHGELIAEHVRIDGPDGGKSYFWRRNGQRGLRGVKSEDLPLYGVERLAGAAEGTIVVVTEGEKAAHALIARGIPAVGTITGAATPPGGASLQPLTRFTVLLWPDNDPPGAAHMRRIAERLLTLGCGSVRTVVWPEAPDHGDAADFFAQDGTLEALERMLDQAPPVEQGPVSEASEDVIAALKDGNGRFVPARVARLLSERGPCFSLGGRLYRYCRGVYVPDGGESIRKEAAELLGDAYSRRLVGEITGCLRDLSPVGHEDIDADPYTLNVANGLLDVRALELRDHTPDYRSVLQVPHRFEAEARCTAIDRFFRDLVPEDCVPLLYQICGYALRRDLPARTAFLLVGAGRNGKSKFLELLVHLVGDTNTSSVTLQDLSGDKFASAELFGKLLNVHSDLPSTALRDNSLFRSITGGDRISAQCKHQSRFEFRPHCKLVFSANRPPDVGDQPRAFHERWLVVPFDNRFEGDSDDPGIVQKLTTTEQLEGLLVAALRVVQRFTSVDGFTVPPRVRQATDAFCRRADTVASFIQDACVLDADASIPKTVLHTAYVEWTRRRGIDGVLGRNELYRRLPHACDGRVRAGRDRSGTSRLSVWRGIRLREGQTAA